MPLKYEMVMDKIHAKDRNDLYRLSLLNRTMNLLPHTEGSQWHDQLSSQYFPSPSTEEERISKLEGLIHMPIKEQSEKNGEDSNHSKDKGLEDDDI
jgi:hypothetical protein